MEGSSVWFTLVVGLAVVEDAGDLAIPCRDHEVRMRDALQGVLREEEAPRIRVRPEELQGADAALLEEEVIRGDGRGSSLQDVPGVPLEVGSDLLAYPNKGQDALLLSWRERRVLKAMSTERLFESCLERYVKLSR